MSNEFKRWGAIEQMSLRHGDHSLDFIVDNDLAGEYLTRAGSKVGGAEGGYLLLRFDVDHEPYSVVHVDPPAGWWPVDEDSAPDKIVRRAAEYLTVLAERLEKINALEG